MTYDGVNVNDRFGLYVKKKLKDQGSHSNKSTYHSNQQLTFKSIDLLVLLIVDYIGIGWI